MKFAPYILVLGLSAGCATNQAHYTALNDGSGLERRQASPTETMTAGERGMYYLGWFSLAGLYTWAGSTAVPLAPP
jgi:hypothetical protein